MLIARRVCGVASRGYATIRPRRLKIVDLRTVDTSHTDVNEGEVEEDAALRGATTKTGSRPGTAFYDPATHTASVGDAEQLTPTTSHFETAFSKLYKLLDEERSAREAGEHKAAQEILSLKKAAQEILSLKAAQQTHEDQTALMFDYTSPFLQVAVIERLGRRIPADGRRSPKDMLGRLLVALRDDNRQATLRKLFPHAGSAALPRLGALAQRLVESTSIPERNRVAHPPRKHLLAAVLFAARPRPLASDHPRSDDARVLLAFLGRDEFNKILAQIKNDPKLFTLREEQLQEVAEYFDEVEPCGKESI